LDEEGIRYIRSLSDTLLRLSDEELWRELSEFQRQVEELESKTHQIKTQTSFISTVLRPFNNKYVFRWFAERNQEIDVEQMKRRIEQLENRRLDSVDDLYNWGFAVEELFFDLVVHRDEQSSPRPFGTVGARSARTYVQAWGALMKRRAEEILLLAANPDREILTGPNLNQDQSTSPDYASYSQRRPSELKSHDALKNYSAPRPSRPRSDNSMRFSLARSTDFSYEPPGLDKAVMSFSQDVPSAPIVETQPLIVIAIESKIDSSAKASKKWKTERDFNSAIDGWIETLPVLWGDAATQLLAKVTIKGNEESDITLPSLTPQNAAELIRSAVVALTNN
jgi:regulator of replication initiation timing